MKKFFSSLLIKQNRIHFVILISFFFLILSALSFPYYQKYVDKNWDNYLSNKISKDLEEFQDFFTNEQKKLLSETNSVIKTLKEVQLSNNYSLLKEQDKFLKTLITKQRRGFSFLLIDTNYSPVAWSDYIITKDKQILSDAIENFLLLRTNFQTHLIYGRNLSFGEVNYFLISSKILEENYQIRNEFIKKHSLTDYFTEKFNLKTSILWDTVYFSIKAEILSNNLVSYKPIKYLNGKTAFYVSIQKPEKEIYLLNLSNDFGQFQKIVFLLLMSFLVFSLFKDIGHVQSRLSQAIAVTILIWLYRAVLLILDFPAFLIEGNITNPSIYASRFFYGMVKSPLELFITSSALAINLIILLVLYKIHLIEKNDENLSLDLKSKIIIIIPRIILLILTPLVVRGFGASFRSFVFDSTIKFFEQPSLIPDPIHLIMYYSVFTTGLSLVLFLFLVIFFIYQSLRILIVNNDFRISLIIIILLFIPLFIFSLIDKNPQYSLLTILLLTVSVTIVAISALKEDTIVTFRSIFLVLILSSLFSSIFLYEKNEEQERELQKTIAFELLKPREQLINYAINQTLQQIATDYELARLFFIESNLGFRNFDFNNIAYRLWINSLLSDEGLNSYLFLFDKYGKPIGSFGFGMDEPLYINQYFEPRLVQNLTIFLIRSHTPNDLLGVIPIKFNNSTVGFCGIVIELSQENFKPVATNTLFKNIKYEKNPFNLLPDAVVYQYRKDHLELVKGHNLPEIRNLDENLINNALNNNKKEIWIKEEIDDLKYTSFYFIYDATQPFQLIIVSIPQTSLILVVFSLFKFILVHIIISLFLLLLGTVILYLKGYKFKLKFKTRLFIGLFFITLIPIIILAYFTRESEMQRWKENLSNELKKDLDVLNFQLNSNYSFDELKNLAQKLGIDFNVFQKLEVIYSTQNKLYQLGFFPKTIPSNIYNALIVENKNYDTVFEYISDYPYLVGYKKVDGNENLILSIPTLYRHEEIRRELAQIDTFILGAYSLTILLIFLFGNLFFEKLTRPISELTEATRKVSSGDLSIKLEKNETGEVGDLIEAFNKMISDLEESRKNLARIEREHAWKEMAKQVAHEIKNPLTPMKLSLQHLQFLYKENKKEFSRIFGKVSTTLIEQIEALTKITNEFSHFARMPERKIIKCDLEEILKEIINLFSAEINIEFEAIKNETFFVNADREELKRVFINIIKNSIQANSKNIKIKLYKDANYCFINIEDDGSGIPQEILDKIFDPNFSTKTEGTGLGLAIVKRILNDLNGTIELKSEVGSGTIVMIAIPKIMDEFQ